VLVLVELVTHQRLLGLLPIRRVAAHQVVGRHRRVGDGGRELANQFSLVHDTRPRGA
jgi:hypothetical protein